MPLLQPIDHILEGLSRVISQYREKPKFNKYLACLLDQVQLLDDAANAVFDAYCLDAATDGRLDELGALVGKTRYGSTDEEYRLWISAWIRSNRSYGRTSDLLSIANILLPSYSYSSGSGWIWFDCRGAGLNSDTAVAVQRILQRAAPQDGRVYLVWKDDTQDTASFTWASAGECLGESYAERIGGWDTAAGSEYPGLWLNSSTP